MRRSSDGLYISIMSRPAENTEFDDEVRIMPKHLFFLTAAIPSTKSVSSSRFRLFTGGLFMVTVAIPDSELMSTLTSFPAVEQHRVFNCSPVLAKRAAVDNLLANILRNHKIHTMSRSKSDPTS